MSVSVAPSSSSLPVTSFLLIVTTVFGLIASQTVKVVPLYTTPPLFWSTLSFESTVCVAETICPFWIVNSTELGMISYLLPCASTISLPSAAVSVRVYVPSSSSTSKLLSVLVVISSPLTTLLESTIFRCAFSITASPVIAFLSTFTFSLSGTTTFLASQIVKVVPSRTTPPFSWSTAVFESTVCVAETICPFLIVNSTELGMISYLLPCASTISLPSAAVSVRVYVPSSSSTSKLLSVLVVISSPLTTLLESTIFRCAFSITASPVTACLSTVMLVVFATSHIIKYGSFLSANFVRTRPPLAFSSAVKLSTLAFAPVHSTVPSALTSNLNSVVMTL